MIRVKKHEYQEGEGEGEGEGDPWGLVEDNAMTHICSEDHRAILSTDKAEKNIFLVDGIMIRPVARSERPGKGRLFTLNNFSAIG